MNRNQAKKIMQRLNQLIENIPDTYLQSIYQVISRYVNNEISQIECKEKILDFIYRILEEVYTITSEEIRKGYKRIAKFTVKNVMDLTYHVDGKTLEDRISSYLNENSNKLILFKKIYDLILNESKIVESCVVKGKLQKIAYLLVIECDENDCHLNCSEYAGEYPADEDVPLPPYHPSCMCTYYYVVTDDEDDIHDLDLEVDEII